MIEISDKSDCCGCTACASICAHSAITMEKDALGFRFPKVNNDLCTNCGLCERICQFKQSYNRFDNFDISEIFLARFNDTTQLKKSQSGGVFYAIARNVIQIGGIVYGAAFNEVWDVTHQRIDNQTDLEKLRMSKYVQSDMQGVFTSVKKDLSSNKIVLFSGTPCQISGLKSYIPIRLHYNLYCIDIICHSVPSPQIWEDYIKYIKEKRKKGIVDIKFRDKSFGWHGARESFKYDDGSVEYRRTNNTLYFKLLSIRESCTKCPYTNLKRVGDLTLGDFWGLPLDSKYEDNQGVSLVLVNSEKGVNLLNQISDCCIIEPGENYNFLQPQLVGPVTMNALRGQFLNDYVSKGFEYIAFKYSDIGWRYKKDRYVASIKRIINKLRNK